MIKSFKKFNEQVDPKIPMGFDPFFMKSEEFEEVLEKNSLSKEIIMDYLDEIYDSNEIEIKNISSSLRGISETSFTSETVVRTEKSYKKRTQTLDNYLSLITEQSEDLNTIKKYCQRISDQENYDLDFKSFHSDSGVDKYGMCIGTLHISIVFSKRIEDSDLGVAYEKYKSKSSYRSSYIEVVKKMISSGISEKDVKSLIDVHPGMEEMEVIVFGFLTSDEIIEIAEFDKESKKINYFEENITKSVKLYNEGECDEYINPE